MTNSWLFCVAVKDVSRVSDDFSACITLVVGLLVTRHGACVIAYAAKKAMTAGSGWMDARGGRKVSVSSIGVSGDVSADKDRDDASVLSVG